MDFGKPLVEVQNRIVHSVTLFSEWASCILYMEALQGPEKFRHDDDDVDDDDDDVDDDDDDDDDDG